VLREEKYVRLTTTETSDAWTHVFVRRSGWRMADGGKSIPLASGQSLWLWGDSFATCDEDCPVFPELVVNPALARDPVWGIIGSTIAISGRHPSEPVDFYGRIPKGANRGKPVRLSDSAGIRELAACCVPQEGAWEWTGNEAIRGLGHTRLWVNCGASIGNMLVLSYEGVELCSPKFDPTCGQYTPEQRAEKTDDATEFRWDGSQWLYLILNTDQPIENWIHLGRVPLTPASPIEPIKWWWLYDDRNDSGYIYAFGLLPSNSGNLYVARMRETSFDYRESSLFDYSSWEFLHRSSSPGAALDSEDWRPGDASLATLWPLATHVGQEFSINKLTVNGVTRWLLVHSRWSSPNDKPENQWVYQFTGIGILRVSTSNSFTTFPDKEEDLFWTCVKDVDPDFNRPGADADPDNNHPVDLDYGAIFRGFSLHSDLSASVRDPPPIEPGTKRPFPVLLGYTLFDYRFPGVDPPPHSIWVALDCANIGDGQHCGARRFAEIDLADIWPERIVWRPVGPRPPPIVGQPVVPRPPIFREPIIPGPYPPPPETIGLPTRLPGENLIRNPAATAGLHGFGASSAPYASAGLGAVSNQYTSARSGSSLAGLAAAGLGSSVREASGAPGTPGASASFGLDAPASLATAGLATAVDSFAAAPVPSSVSGGPQRPAFAAQSIQSVVANAGLGSVSSEYAAAGLGSAQQTITANAFAARPTSSVPNAAAAEPPVTGVSLYDAAALTGLGDIAAQKATAGLDAAVSSGATGRFAARSVAAPLAPSVESAYGRAGGTK
jgi:hypothetical protein